MRPDYAVKALLPQTAAVAPSVSPRQETAFAYGNDRTRQRGVLSFVAVASQLPVRPKHGHYSEG